jgi:hypothetical protein
VFETIEKSCPFGTLNKRHGRLCVIAFFSAIILAFARKDSGMHKSVTDVSGGAQSASMMGDGSHASPSLIQVLW